MSSRGWSMTWWLCASIHCQQTTRDAEKILWFVITFTPTTYHPFLTRNRSRRFTGLQNITTSALYCVLLFAAPVFSDIADQIDSTLHSATVETENRDTMRSARQTLHPFRLPAQLPAIISLVFWWPSNRTDTPEDRKFVRGTQNRRPFEYYASIRQLSEAYLTDVNNYISKGGPHSTNLDKPNAHRLLD